MKSEARSRRTQFVPTHGFDVKDRRGAQGPPYRATDAVRTGLPDRAFLEDRLALEIAHGDNSGGKIILALLNLDRFGETDDVLEHKVADQLLQKVANRLRSRLRKSDTVARLGGDELLLLLPRIKRKEDVESVAERILRSLRQPFPIGALRFRVTGTVGFAVYPDHGKDAETLIRNAGIAMNCVKQRGRNNYRCFNSTMDAA